MIRLILVPLDGSEVSRSVLPTIEDLAAACGATVVLFHAVTPVIATYPGVEMIATSDGMLDERRIAAERFLADTAAPLEAAGLAVSRLVTIGSPVDAILSAALELRADMIAMSTHGRSGVGRLILGSVADAVLLRTHLPCLLLRPEHVGASRNFDVSAAASGASR